MFDIAVEREAVDEEVEGDREGDREVDREAVDGLKAETVEGDS